MAVQFELRTMSSLGVGEMSRKQQNLLLSWVALDQPRKRKRDAPWGGTQAVPDPAWVPQFGTSNQGDLSVSLSTKIPVPAQSNLQPELSCSFQCAAQGPRNFCNQLTSHQVLGGGRGRRARNKVRSAHARGGLGGHRARAQGPA